MHLSTGHSEGWKNGSTLWNSRANSKSCFWKGRASGTSAGRSCLASGSSVEKQVSSKISMSQQFPGTKEGQQILCWGRARDQRKRLFPCTLHLLYYCQAPNTGEALTVTGSSSAEAPLWWGLEHWSHKEILEEWDCSARAKTASGDLAAAGANREVTEGEPGSSQQRTGRWEPAGITWNNKSLKRCAGLAWNRVDFLHSSW